MPELQRKYPVIRRSCRVSWGTCSAQVTQTRSILTQGNAKPCIREGGMLDGPAWWEIGCWKEMTLCSIWELKENKQYNWSAQNKNIDKWTKKKIQKKDICGTKKGDIWVYGQENSEQQSDKNAYIQHLWGDPGNLCQVSNYISYRIILTCRRDPPNNWKTGKLLKVLWKVSFACQNL